jgi:uncharacterized protein (DUF2235 family)
MGKNIVICSDGTGQLAGDAHPSNVVELCKLLYFDKSDSNNPKTQVGCYDAGVGTITNQKAIAELKDYNLTMFVDEEKYFRRIIRNFSGLAIGYGLKENVMQIYEYLTKNYDDGSKGKDPDRIYLFGFSRGAFTVRVLAGLLCRCGLLNDMELFSEAYKRYDRHYEEIKDDSERSRIIREDREFKDRYSRPCKIKFLGVWDTVKAYGYIRPLSLPHTRHNEIVDIVRHALSIDEHRKFYEPTSWGGLDPDPNDPEGECVQPIAGQDVREVWFAGDHSGIGGGHPDGNNGLAQIALKWMINEAVNADKDDNQKLLVNKNRYRDTLGQLRPDRNDYRFKRHDKLQEKFWQFAQRAPRKELKNCPPPPHTSDWTMNSTDRRDIRKFRRNKTVLLHSTVTELYSDSEKTERWGSIDPDPRDFTVVYTNEYVLR